MSFLKKLFGKDTKTTLSKVALLELFAQRLQNLPNIAEVSVDKADGRIDYKTTDKNTGSWFIDNCWAQYQQKPENLEGLIKSHLTSIQSQFADEKSFEERQKRFFPMVKPSDWLETSKQQLRKMNISEEKIKEQFVYQILNDELLVTYAEDTPEQMSFLTQKDVEAVGGIEALHRIALDNFTTQMLPQVKVQGSDGRYALRLDGYFDATLVLVLEHFLPQMALVSTPLIAVPARDELLICSDNADEDIWTMLDMVDAIYAQSGYAVSKKLFRWHEGGRLVAVNFQRYEKDEQRVLNELKETVH